MLPIWITAYVIIIVTIRINIIIIIFIIIIAKRKCKFYYSRNLCILHCNKKRELKDKWISRFAFTQSFFQVLLNHYIRFFKVGGLLPLSFYTKLPVFASNIFFYIFFLKFVVTLKMCIYKFWNITLVFLTKVWPTKKGVLVNIRITTFTVTTFYPDNLCLSRFLNSNPKTIMTNDKILLFVDHSS